MKHALWPAALASLFCGAAATDVPASTATALPQAMRLAKGRWHSVITITSAEVRPVAGRAPIPPGTEAALKAKIGRPFETDDCIGARPSGGGLVLPGVQIGEGCRYEEAEAQGGHMRLKAHCGDDARGFEADFTADGRYTPTIMETVLETETTAREAGYSTRMTIGIRSRQAGQCQPR